MHDVPAFEDEVSANPAITILRNGQQRAAHVVDAAKDFNATHAASITRWVKGDGGRKPTSSAFDACKIDTWFSGRDLWPTGSPSQLALLTDLEHRFTPIEDARTGTRVGIGVATGCDEVYITRDADLVEEDRLLPLLLASDLAGGTPQWSGRYLVDPWNGAGLVDLAKYPKLRRYFERWAALLGRVRATEALVGL